MLKLYLYLSFILCLFPILLVLSDDFYCGHDTEGGNYAALDNQIALQHESDNSKQNTNNLNLQEDVTSTWQNMRISLNYTTLDANNDLTFSEKQMVRSSMNGAINFLQRTLRLDRVINGIHVNCGGILSCNNCDLVLRVQASSCSYKAAASACASDSLTGRNVAGTITWCYNAIRTPRWNRDVEIAVHEVVHVLGFSNGDFQNWLDAPYPSGGKPRGNNVLKYITSYTGNKYSLKTPQVIETVRNHFNCNSIDGAFLEEYGGAGSASSHWDYRMFLGDLMCAKSNDPVDVFSKMTAAALEDSNWYRVNWDYITDWKYGQNEGCNFLFGSCLDNDGTTPYPEFFCDELNSNGCWWDRTVAHAPCVMNISNTCPYAYPNDICGYEWNDFCPLYRLTDGVQKTSDSCQTGFNTIDETIAGSGYGINSRCTISSINNKGIKGGTNTQEGRCYKMECLNYNSNLLYYEKIKIIIGNNINSTNITCNRNESNEQIRKFINNNYFYGEIECPPIDIICGTQSKSFECLFGNYNDNLASCVCNVGYIGAKCDQFDNATITIAPTTPPTTFKPTPKPTNNPTKPICCLARSNARCSLISNRQECDNHQFIRKQCYWDTSNPLCL